MKGLNHPNIGEKGKGVGSEAVHQGTWGRSRGQTCFLVVILLLTGPVTLAKSLTLSEHQFPPLEWD